MVPPQLSFFAHPSTCTQVLPVNLWSHGDVSGHWPLAFLLACLSPCTSTPSSKDPAGFRCSLTSSQSFASSFSLSHLTKPHPWLCPLSSLLSPCEGGQAKLEKITRPHRLAGCMFKVSGPSWPLRLYPWGFPNLLSLLFSQGLFANPLLSQTWSAPLTVHRKPHLFPQRNMKVTRGELHMLPALKLINVTAPYLWFLPFTTEKALLASKAKSFQSSFPLHPQTPSFSAHLHSHPTCSFPSTFK